jgi:hypothetical protein
MSEKMGRFVGATEHVINAEIPRIPKVEGPKIQTDFLNGARMIETLKSAMTIAYEKARVAVSDSRAVGSPEHDQLLQLEVFRLDEMPTLYNGMLHDIETKGECSSAPYNTIIDRIEEARGLATLR